VAGQVVFALAVTFPVLLGFLIGIVDWRYGTTVVVLTGAAIVAAIVVAFAPSSTWRYIAPFAGGFWFVGVGLGIVSRRLARRVVRASM
jgi:phosphatidylserine decarboxylase